MLKYCIIQLCDSSVSFCHYTSVHNRNLMPLSFLTKGILWSVKNRLNLHIVYPDYRLPSEYTAILNQHPHVKICSEIDRNADIMVINGWDSVYKTDNTQKPVIIHTSFREFIENHHTLANNFNKFSRVNIIFTDVANFKDSNIQEYEKALNNLSDSIYFEYKSGNKVQLNLLTDRLMLTSMNNCNAGYEVVTLSPNGKFYPCPGFYMYNMNEIGSIDNGLDIPNFQLYRLEYAPICRRCDAFHCKRCVMLNKQLTLETNTPSHQQCIMSHTERKITKRLLEKFRIKDNLFPEVNLQEIEYNDPFEIITK